MVNTLNPSGRDPIVGDVEGFDCSLGGGTWDWAAAHDDEIAAHWAEARAAKPDLFDGDVLIATEVGIEDSRLVSEHAAVRYSALLYWRKRGYPRADAFNLFGAGVVVAADGAVLLGTMAGHTANAGQTYFPCGTPDLNDVEEGMLDLDASILRELEEETGLTPDHLRASGRRWISWDGPLFCCARRIDTALTAAEAGSLISAHLAAQPRPELAGVLFARSLADLEGLNVPAYARMLVAELTG